MPGYQYRGNQRDTETPVPDRTPRPSIPTPTTRRDPAVVTTKPAPAKLPVWEEPPASSRGSGSSTYRSRVLAELKSHLGKWARVKEGMKSSAGAATWKKAGCEAVSRRDPSTKLYNVWARWPETKA